MCSTERSAKGVESTLFTVLAVGGAALSVSLAIYGAWRQRVRGEETDMTNYVAAATIFTAIMATLAVNLK